MANRFPLVLDTTDNNKIKEIQSGDNLNLAENSIVDVQNITALGTINAADIKVNGNRIVAQAFADLTDTPASFIGSPNYFVKVKPDGTGLEYRPLSDLGNIEIDTITVDTSIVPSVHQSGSIGTLAARFDSVYATSLYGNLRGYNDEIVFNASTAKISYAALEGVPSQLSDFTDDVGFLKTADLNTVLAGLFDDGVPFTTDIIGSVFGDDSTLLVDGVNSIITGDVLNSQITTTNLITSTAQITTTTVSNINGPSTGNLTIDPGASGIIDIGTSAGTTAVNIENAVIETFNQGSGLGVAQLTANTDLEINAGNRVKITGGIPFRFSSTTTALQLAIGAQEGDVIYNTSTSRLQMYQGGAWKDVNGNVEATAGTSNFNNVVVAGDLTVQGTTTSIETTNTDITDNVITLNKGELGVGVSSLTSGIEIDRGTETNVTLVWDDSIDKWTVGAERFVAATFEGNLLGDVIASDIEIDGAAGRLTFDSLTAPEIRNSDGTVRVVLFGEDYLPGTAQLYVEANDVWLYSDLLVEQNAVIKGAVTASAFKGTFVGDDSTILLDGIESKIVGDVDNAEVVTTTVQGRDNEALNIYRGIGGTVSLGDASSGSVAVNDSGINITSTAGVDIDGAVGGTVDIGTGATTGNVTIGKVGNTTTINGTLNAALTGDVIGNVDGNVTGDVTGNIDNTTLAIGTTDATAINIGNSGSTTTIAGNLALTNALIVNNLRADDSITITTAVGDGNAITLGPAGTNTAININADDIRINGSVTTEIVAQGGITGDLKGSVVGDDSTVLIDGVAGKIVGDIASTNIHGAAFKADTIVNNNSTTLDITAAGFLNIFGGADDAGVSNIQMDKNGINHIELKTEPGNPGNPTDYARVAINAGTNEGDVRIGTPVSTRNQVVEVYNATVYGTLDGSANGAHTGSLEGDVIGSLFADDSSPMIDASNRTMFSDALTLTPLLAEPTSPVAGQLAVADGTSWDPSGGPGVGKQQTVIYLGSAWVQIAIEA